MSEQLSSISIDEKKSKESSAVYLIIFLIVAAVFVFLLIKDEMTDQTSQQTTIDVSKPQITQVEQPKDEVVEAKPEVVESSIDIEPEIFEVAEEEPKVTLPNLNESDSYIINIVENLSWRKELLELVLTDDLIRRIVVTADNFAQGELAYSHIPLQPPIGRFQTEKSSETGEGYLISQSNNQRYRGFIDLLHSFDVDSLASQYKDVKPLFEQAYSELGYPDKKFDDVVKASIERILDMPVPAESPALSRPNVVYQFTDKDLEQLNDADKLLLRIGKENLLQLKAFALTLNNHLNNIH